MKIFIRGLPNDTSPASLRAFSEVLLKPPWYLPMRPRIGLKSCVVLKVEDLQRKTVEFHGVLVITPYKHAMDAINRINRQRFHGRLLEARKWSERVGLNDRRNLYSPDESGFHENRRARDRRRYHLVIETYEPLRFKGLRQFYRELE